MIYWGNISRSRMLKDAKSVVARDACDRSCHSPHAFGVSANVETRENAGNNKSIYDLKVHKHKPMN
jgi:hypothetical protein